MPDGLGGMLAALGEVPDGAPVFVPELPSNALTPVTGAFVLPEIMLSRDSPAFEREAPPPEKVFHIELPAVERSDELPAPVPSVYAAPWPWLLGKKILLLVFSDVLVPPEAVLLISWPPTLVCGDALAPVVKSVLLTPDEILVVPELLLVPLKRRELTLGLEGAPPRFKVLPAVAPVGMYTAHESVDGVVEMYGVPEQPALEPPVRGIPPAGMPLPELSPPPRILPTIPFPIPIATPVMATVPRPRHVVGPTHIPGVGKPKVRSTQYL